MCHQKLCRRQQLEGKVNSKSWSQCKWFSTCTYGQEQFVLMIWLIFGLSFISEEQKENNFLHSALAAISCSGSECIGTLCCCPQCIHSEAVMGGNIVVGVKMGKSCHFGKIKKRQRGELIKKLHKGKITKCQTNNKSILSGFCKNHPAHCFWMSNPSFISCDESTVKTTHISRNPTA